jgi:Lipocalin-like domain
MTHSRLRQRLKAICPYVLGANGLWPCYCFGSNPNPEGGNIMRRAKSITITTLSCLLLLGSALAAQAQALKQQLVGTWIVVSSSTKLPDGSPAWGSNPKGLVIFTENGHYSSQLMRSDRPKFASNNRTTGTPEENKAAVQGAISSFGTYSVDEANKTFTIRYQASSYPNLEGTEQTRPFTIAGDELKVTNPAPSAGGPPSQIVYKRAK